MISKTKAWIGSHRVLALSLSGALFLGGATSALVAGGSVPEVDQEALDSELAQLRADYRVSAEKLESATDELNKELGHVDVTRLNQDKDLVRLILRQLSERLDGDIGLGAGQIAAEPAADLMVDRRIASVDTELNSVKSLQYSYLSDVVIEDLDGSDPQRLVIRYTTDSDGKVIDYSAWQAELAEQDAADHHTSP